ncbi:GNAT family N-acetyltransferase [Sphingomonas sp.]|uniref:GNAT family N-acetyltransferase n=1 Tax=Sphingomonas sp. TaxID=28214 RepID=UPI0025E05AD2|nr:GNAT family N-acetyltransferase [Sphingomonas sp.]
MTQQTSQTLHTERSRWSAALTTRTGLALHVRTAGEEDKAALADLFRHVGAEHLRERFSSTMLEVDDARLSTMACADDPTLVTFLAFLGDGTLVACATLCDNQDGESADVALSVHRDWRGRGVSWTLLEHVLVYAEAHGLREVTSLETPEERAAINLEREMGFVVRLASASPVELKLSKLLRQD